MTRFQINKCPFKKRTAIKCFLLLFLAWPFLDVRAQFPIRVQVNVIQPVPPYLPQIKADIAGNRSGRLNQDISSHLSILLTSTGRGQEHIKLAGSIERVAPTPLGVSLRSDYQPAQPIIMGPQQPILSLNKDMLQMAFGNFSENSLVYSNTDLNTLRQNGIDYKLPEGTYRVCVTAYDYDRPGFSTPLSAPGTGCAFFTICYTASAPQLILPVSTMLQSNTGFQDFVPHSSQVQFIWTPPATTCGTPVGALNYDLEIRRVFEGQTVTDAQSNPYAFHQQNIPSTTFLLDTLKYAHVLVPGQKYTVRVKANFIPTVGSPLEIANQGYSQIGGFTYQPPAGLWGNGLAVNTPKDSSSPLPPGSTILPGGYIVQAYSPGGSCPATLPVANTNMLLTGIAEQDIMVDGFRLHVDQATPNNDGSYRGSGSIIWHPFSADLLLKVSFDTLLVNADKVVFGGRAITVADIAYTGSNADAIESRINDGQHLLNQGLGSIPVGFPLGLTTTVGGSSAMPIAIMGITFQATCTNMSALLNVNVPDLGGWLTLSGSGFQIDPNKVLLQDKGGILYLPQNLNLSLGGMKFNFDGCPGGSAGIVDTSKGSYVLWDGTNGLSKIMINADLQFTSGKSIVAVDKNDLRLSAPAGLHLKFGFADWNDWIAAVTLDNDFELAGLPGFPIHSDGLFYDHSSRQNPVGIVFPEKYAGAQDMSFQGLYSPSLTMKLPNNFGTFSGSKPGGFGFHNFILDNSGVTTTISADHILDISTGSLGGWAFSIDHIGIGIVQDNFQDGMQMTGQLKLPVSSTSLAYSCSLNSGSGQVNYLFVVHPSGELDVPLWVAKLNLDPNSSLVIANDANGMAVKTHLNGNITVDVDVKPFPKFSLPGLGFQDMAMANRKDTSANAPAGFYFDPGKWSFGGMDLSKIAALDPVARESFLAGGPNANGNSENAPDDAGSSQGTVAGFGISLSDFKPSFNPNSLTEFEAGVYFNLNVNVGFGDASVISGTARLGLLGKISIPGTSAPTVSFDKIDCPFISLHGGIGPVTVDGQLNFLNGDKTFGDGVSGSLTAKFPFADFVAAAQFGTTLGAGGFHYWAVGGSIFLTGEGVPIGPGLFVNGFGGGIYHNMSLSTPGDAEIRSHNSSPGTIPMVPQVNTTGIQAELIASVIQPYVVNASLTLSVEIHNGGLSLMELDGNGFVITDPPENSDALASAYVKMKYDFVNQIFDTYVDAQFHFLISSANAPIWMHGGPDGDYLYVGRPDQGDDQRVSLNLIEIGSKGDVLWVDLGATAYFDAGTELPAFPPLPPIISTNLDKSGNDNAVGTMLQILNKAKNPGFMFGAEVHGHIQLDLLFLYAAVDAELGFDVAMQKVLSPPAGCVQQDGTFGLNNWYASGQLYAYFDLTIGLHVDAWFFSGDITLVEEKAWAVLQAGLPNPSWVDGEVHVEGSVLGGLVSVSGDFPFSFGTQCKISFNPLDNIQMITDIGPKDSAAVYDLPYAAYSVPMDGRDYPITVPSDANHSTAYTRTFRFYQNQFNIYKVKTGGDSLVAGIGTGGDLNTSKDGLSGTLYHNDMLQAHTRYKLYVKCGVDEIVNGQSQVPNGNSGSQDTTIYFTTGAGPEQIIAGMVDYTYPITGQRFFLQNEFGRQGQIKLGQWPDNLLPKQGTNAFLAGGYDYKIYFIPATGTDTLKADFTPNEASRTLNFPIPANFQNNLIYDLQVWVIPRKSAALEQVSIGMATQAKTMTNQSSRQVSGLDNKGQVVQHQVTSQSTLTINSNIVKIKPQGHPLGSIPIYTLKFQTSQYNTFNDKMAAYGKWSGKSEDNFRDISLYSQLATGEQFDEYDIKGFTSTCSMCDPNTFQANYPPLFSAVIPWDNNSQNDKFAADNLYANAFLMAVNGMQVDMGAPEVRDLMRPVYTLSTDGIPYQPRIPQGFVPIKSTAQFSVSGSRSMADPSTTKPSGSGGLQTMERIQNPGASLYTQGTVIGLPASYQSGAQSPAPQQLTGTFLGVGLKTTSVQSGPRLLWLHDNYIYADYQLLQQFAKTFLANQQNMVWMPGGSIPLSLLQALAYGNNVTLANGEYGSITADPSRYSTKWNDPSLTNIANSIKGMSFQVFPATSARLMQFKYQYPFCSGCFPGSTVPESFSFGNSGQLFEPIPAASGISVKPVGKQILISKPKTH